MSHPNPDNKPSLHARLRKTKAAFLATALTLAGILLIMLNGWLSGLSLGAWSWLHALPLGELGGTLFGAGLLGGLFTAILKCALTRGFAGRRVACA